jgi:hypothetical protein
MGRKARVDRSPEEKWQIVQEGIKSGNLSETCPLLIPSCKLGLGSNGSNRTPAQSARTSQRAIIFRLKRPEDEWWRREESEETAILKTRNLLKFRSSRYAGNSPSTVFTHAIHTRNLIVFSSPTEYSIER